MPIDPLDDDLLRFINKQKPHAWWLGHYRHHPAPKQQPADYAQHQCLKSDAPPRWFALLLLGFVLGIVFTLTFCTFVQS